MGSDRSLRRGKGRAGSRCLETGRLASSFFVRRMSCGEKTGRQRKECLYAGIAEYAFPGILICATIVHIDTRISGVRKHGEIPNIISKM